jgi:hypothetical protein
MRWIGLMSKPGSSPFTLIMWFSGCVEIFMLAELSRKHQEVLLGTALTCRIETEREKGGMNTTLNLQISFAHLQA